MKKLFLLNILLIVALVVFSGCGYIYVATPEDTNLEFWITQRVAWEDFDGHAENYGWFGAREFYGTGYIPTEVEGSNQIDPEYCVKYLVTSYPDYSSNKLAVTGIEITDPQITFYGLTLNSTEEQITQTMQKLGYKMGEEGTMLCAYKGNVRFRFSIGKSISINAGVSNRFGIVF